MPRPPRPPLLSPLLPSALRQCRAPRNCLRLAHDIRLPVFETQVRGGRETKDIHNFSREKQSLGRLAPKLPRTQPDDETVELEGYGGSLLQRPPPRFHILKSRRMACRGCGIKLQNSDPNAVGYAYTPTAAHNVHINKRARVDIRDIFDTVLAECNDVDLAEKLQNTDKATKTLEQEAQKESQTQDKHKHESENKFTEVENQIGLQKPVRSFGPDDRTALIRARLRIDRVPTHTGNEQWPRNICLRCHEMQHHSNPSPIKTLPPAPTPAALLAKITATPSLDPPLFVIVLDPVDFPLCFFPFKVPRGANVLFVVNRADVLCERASAMEHLQEYFRSAIADKLRELGIELDGWEVHCVSVKKMFGLKECLNALIRLKSRDAHVYFLGYTNVGKSSVIGALLGEAGYPNPFIKKPKNRVLFSAEEKLEYRRLAPTTSHFPRTTMQNVAIPWGEFTKYLRTSDSEKNLEGPKHGRGAVIDTPGFDQDHTFLSGFIDDEYELDMSLSKVGGFQRPASKMRAGQSMSLGGLIRIDLLQVVPHAQTPTDPHIRITAFTNLPCHLTSTPKAESILHQPPSSFHDRKSKIEVVTNRAVGPLMKVALETDVRSTGNSQRNTLEVVVAGLGFVAVGGNFERARVRVWSPEGRGVGVRRAIVREIEGGYSLMVRKAKATRTVLSGRKKEGWRAENMTEKVQEEEEAL